MPTFITQNTVKAALAACDDRETVYDVSDTQIRGLSLRVRKSKVNWSVRTILHDKPKRYDLGPVCIGPNDEAGAITLKTARARAYAVKAMCDAGIPPLRQLEAWAFGVTVEKAEALDADKPKPSWEWSDAITKFVAWNKEYRRPDSADDYEQKLAEVPEMHRFRGRQVNTLTRNELMEAVNDIAARGV